MAALTSPTIRRENNGSLTLHQFTFASVGTGGDTYVSGFPTGVVVGYWANATTGVVPEIGAVIDTGASSAVTSTNHMNGTNVGYVDSTATFTINTNYPSAVVLNVWSTT